jgi:hypothetical protein
MIDYYVMSFPEMIGLFQGLELQAMLRTWLPYLPYLFLVVGALILTTRASTQGTVWAWVRLGLYVFWGFLLIALFWPEVSPFGRAKLLSPSQIASYPASQDPQAQMVTAGDTQEVSNRPVLETPGFKLILGYLIDTPLGFARALNPNTHQVFRPMQSIAWYLGLELTAEVTRSLDDWIQGCYKPVMTTDQEFQDAITSKDLMPWGEGPVARALATRQTVPGSSTGGRYLRTTRPLGTLFLANPDSPSTVRCDVYLRAVELDVQRWLFETKSPAGAPLSQVFQEDFGRTVDEQAKWLIYRDILKLIDRPSIVPGLGGIYAGLSSGNSLRGAVTGAVTGAIGGAAYGGYGAGAGALVGGLIGFWNAGQGQFADVLRTITWTVGMAMVFIWSAPEIFGTALLILIGLFPIPFLFMLTPFAGFKSVFMYFLTLLYVCCSPLWFALIDLRMRAAMATAPQSQDAMLGLLNWAPQQAAGARAVVVGLFVVSVVGGIMFFSLARGVAGNIAGALRASQG